MDLPMSWEVSEPLLSMELQWLVLHPNLHSVIERGDGCTWVVRSKKLPTIIPLIP